MIGILVDIAYRNPRTYPSSAAMFSILVDFLETKSGKQKLSKGSEGNSLRSQILGICRYGSRESAFHSTVMKTSMNLFVSYYFQVVRQENKPIQIWNNKWISSKDLRNLRNAIDQNKVVDLEKLDSMASVVPIEEVELFTSAY